jgi:predicted RNA binding protein YcfA (HicA-like mRNA interferase family)
VSRKGKLIARLLGRPGDFTWDEAQRLLKQCRFEQLNNSGSRRKFRHVSGIKLSIHEPHPGNIVKQYALENIIEALQNAGEIE